MQLFKSCLQIIVITWGKVHSRLNEKKAGHGVLFLLCDIDVFTGEYIDKYRLYIYLQ